HSATQPPSLDSRPALIQRWPIPAVNSTPSSSACLGHSIRETPKRALTVFNVLTRLRDDLNRKLDSIRADMLAIAKPEAAMTLHKQHQAILFATILTALAAVLGLVFAALVSSDMARPVRRLLEGARAVEEGRLDETLTVTSQDEIGHLTTAFNR